MIQPSLGLIQMSNSNMRIKFIYLGLFMCVTLITCSESVNTTVDRTSDFYSLYGTLRISDSNNSVRIHDNRLPITDISTKNLSLNVTLTNTKTNQTELLKDSVVIFEEIYTHNFIVRNPIEFDTQYLLKLEDEEGYRDSIRVQAPREAQSSLFLPEYRCDHLNMEVTIDPLNYSAGEFVEFELEFEYDRRKFKTSRYTNRETEGDQVTLFFNIDDAINSGLSKSWSERVSCQEYKINKYTLFYTYFGKELEPIKYVTEQEDGELIPLIGKRMLSSASGSIYIEVDEFYFRDELFSGNCGRYCPDI